MKIRNGFVSNSSSSSFVCGCCTEAFVGYDGLYDGTYKYQCVNGHELCSDCVKEGDFEGDNDVPEEFCPLCRFEIQDEYDTYQYLLKTSGITQKEVHDHFVFVFKDTEVEDDFVRWEDYINYVCVKKGILLIDLRYSLKEKFKTYEKFLEFINDEPDDKEDLENEN